MVKPPAQSGGVTHWELLLSLVSASDFFQVICSTARWHLQLVALGEGRLPRFLGFSAQGPRPQLSVHRHAHPGAQEILASDIWPAGPHSVISWLGHLAVCVPDYKTGSISFFMR